MDGETAKERNARLAKNVDRQCRRNEEAARGVDGDPNAPHHARRNLEDKYDMVGNQPV